MVFKRRAEVHNSSFRETGAYDQVILQKSDGLVRRDSRSYPGSLAAGVQAAFASAGGVPGRPTPPPSPCISTGFLQEDDTSVGPYFCGVRNVGGTSHKVTVDFRDAGNLTDERNLSPIILAPGHGIVFDFLPHTGFTASDACIVTTDEG